MNNKNVFSYGVNLNWVFCVEQNKYFMAQTINNLHIKQQERSTVVVHALNDLPSPSWLGEKKETLENIGEKTTSQST